MTCRQQTSNSVKAGGSPSLIPANKNPTPKFGVGNGADSNKTTYPTPINTESRLQNLETKEVIESVNNYTGTKNSEALTVHLPKEAVEILTERKWKSESPWVFEGNGASGHLADPKKAWMRILKEAGIENLRIHDLRRTLGSYQAALCVTAPKTSKPLLPLALKGKQHEQQFFHFYRVRSHQYALHELLPLLAGNVVARRQRDWRRMGGVEPDAQ